VSEHIAEKSRRDIDRQVSKILHDLGDPDPPLRLELVRELLKLDRDYYSSSCEGGLAGIVHFMKVGLKQVVKRPTLLIEAIRNANLKALLLPDQRRILVDGDLHPSRQRWGEAHEIGHDIIPWHQHFAYGDDESTLQADFQEQVEAEANFAAARLLFLLDRFADEAHSGEITLKRVFALAKSFGNSGTAAVWRVVESSELPTVAVIGARPSQFGGNESAALRHVIRSPRFALEFANVTVLDLFSTIRIYCNGRRGPAGEAEAIIEDARGDAHVFQFESFNNTHDVLTLGTWRRKTGVVVGVPGRVGQGRI
jgi:hypothetical protein